MKKKWGTSLDPQLMSEIGDVSHFTHKGAITTFAGVDPGINEFETYAQKSVPTSKHDSSDLRKTLFQIIDALIKTQRCPCVSVFEQKTCSG